MAALAPVTHLAKHLAGDWKGPSVSPEGPPLPRTNRVCVILIQESFSSESGGFARKVPKVLMMSPIIETWMARS